jgi:hypothetical protein
VEAWGYNDFVLYSGDELGIYLIKTVGDLVVPFKIPISYWPVEKFPSSKHCYEADISKRKNYVTSL